MLSAQWQGSRVLIVALHQLKGHLASGRSLMLLVEESRRSGSGALPSPQDV